MEPLTLHFTSSTEDFSQAGTASSAVKKVLKDLGFPNTVIRRVSIAMYEAEINMVIHANGGEITVTVTPEAITAVFADVGPGIPDIGLAMQEGWSTAPESVRDLGFGAGMGLPNIQKYTDRLDIQTAIGKGTTVTFTVNVT